MPEPQPAIGDVVEVRAPKAGTKATRLLGRVRMEDLTGVLQHISSRTGRNGPQGPLTQFMLKQGALQLAHGLGLTQAAPDPGDQVVERGALSALVGHERFVCQTMGLSVHNMERRWPMASDWYADLIAYILRPQRHRANFDVSIQQVAEWFSLPLGELVRVCAHQQVSMSNDLVLYQLADSVKWLWPNYPPIQEAHRAEMATGEDYWEPLYAEFLRVYDLRLREGVTLEDYAWALRALVTAEAHDQTLLAGFNTPDTSTPSPSPTARSALFFIAGTVETRSGELLSLTELEQRRPAHTPRLDSLMSSA